MSWLNVPHLRQVKPGWCLPACVAMVAAYWQQPLLQDDIAHWLAQQVPCILFVRTSELPYWKVDTPHTVVLAGLESESAHLIDPDYAVAPVTVLLNDLILAWSHSDYTYAVMLPNTR